MNDLTEHFSLAELTVTSQVDDAGRPLPNQPEPSALACLLALCEGALEPIRTLWACPVRVTSGYRSHDVEMKVSHKDYGQHRLGQAADIIPLGPLPIVDAYEAIWKSAIPYDQLILEDNGHGNRWIHVSYTIAPEPRRMAIYSPDNGKSYNYYQPGSMGPTTEATA
jgi:zinc D-Ala-D-Ala carboxypeptidase